MLPIVLSVDDDPSSHILMRAFLEDEAFCEHFVSATSPSQGLEILRQLASDPLSSLPSVIFCDIHMPEMSGWEFIDQAAPYLNDASTSADVIIIMLTGTATDDDEQRAIDSPHVKGLFNKPLGLKLLDELRNSDALAHYFAEPPQQSCL